MRETFISVPLWISAGYFFILGSFFGSFANVLIYRMQSEKTTNLFKRSYCPHCFYNIPFYLNIPLFSWFFLKGRCRNCSKKISFRYPLVELLTSCLFCSLYLAIGWKWFLLEALIFAFFLVVCSFIDLDQMILPDSLTLSGILLGLLGAWLNPERFFIDSFLGFVIGGGILLLISYLYYLIRKKEGMGGGDIKMMAWIGAVLGWQSLFFVLISSCFIGSFLGTLIMLQSNKKFFDKAFPFGPYLAFSAIVYIFLERKFDFVLDFFSFL
ncbi:MAG: prepilin peptidase [Bdellovibrionales bacterium]|nr:prepilin peptidase [Bdellovibrionales bacterium]